MPGPLVVAAIVNVDWFLHVAALPSNSKDAVSNIDEQEPGPLPEVAFPGSKSMLLEEPAVESQTVIDVPSFENRA